MACDGNLVRTEVDVPFGDDSSFWPSTSVANGSHTFEVRAVNGSGTVLAKNTITATVANTTTPPPPPSSTGSITQTIANGATVKGVVSWYAVYDGNGDKVEDDPGKVEWRVDGNLVRTEVDVPFGDDSSFWPSTSVANGSHTFEVRAVNGSGTVLAKNTITATVANTTTPPPPTGDQVAPSQPGNLKVIGVCDERRGRLVARDGQCRGHRLRRLSWFDAHHDDTADQRDPHRPFVRKCVPGRRRRQ